MKNQTQGFKTLINRHIDDGTYRETDFTWSEWNFIFFPFFKTGVNCRQTITYRAIKFFLTESVFKNILSSCKMDSEKERFESNCLDDLLK